MKNLGKNILFLIIITLFILYFALKDNFYDIIKEILSLNIFWFILALVLLLCFYILKTISLKVLIDNFDKSFKFRNVFKVTMVTQFFNAITPFATGGQPFQIYYFNKKGIGISKSTNIVVQHFIIYQIALVTLGILAVITNYTLHIFKKVSLLKSLVTLGFIINVLVIVVLFVVAFGKKLNKKIINLGIKILDKFHLLKDKDKTLDNWNTYINNFHNGAKKLMANKKQFLFTIVIEFTALISLYLIPLMIFYSMGYYDIDPLVCIVSEAYVMLIGSFVPIPGGTGGLEYGFIAFFGNFVKDHVLNAAMIIWRFVTYYLGMIIGGIALMFKKG